MDPLGTGRLQMIQLGTDPNCTIFMRMALSHPLFCKFADRKIFIYEYYLDCTADIDFADV